MTGAEELDEIPEPQVAALLEKLAWALRQEPAPREGTIPFYRIDRRFIEAAKDLVRDAAERHPESYRRHAHRS